jgi:Porphobilinogen deaminase
LAAAGLKRLGMAERIRSLLAPEDSLPAAGQGALGIEIRAGRPEMKSWLAPLNHAPSAMAVTAEKEQFLERWVVLAMFLWQPMPFGKVQMLCIFAPLLPAPMVKEFVDLKRSWQLPAWIMQTKWVCKWLMS